MSLYILDTDTLSLFHRGNERVVKHVLQANPNNLAVTVVTVEEQIDGWYRMLHRDSQVELIVERYRRLAETVRFYSGLNLLDLSAEATIRANELERSKRNIKKNDARIAAIALEHDAIVVTRNIRDFLRVPGLAVENWADE